MGFGRRKKGILKRFFILLFIITIIGSVSYGGYYLYNQQLLKIKNEYVKQIDDLKTEKYLSKRTIYIALKDIKKGEFINETDVNLVNTFSKFESDIFINESDLNSRALIDISEGLPVLKNMICKEDLTDDERLKELSSVLLQSDLEKNEFVDFRIRYSNGLEYIVLSKKEIKKIDLKNNTVWLSLNEKENLLLSSALVDKAIYQGTSFYIDRYIESNIQKKSQVNYLPNKEVMNLMAVNKYVERKFEEKEITKREEIEKKLRGINEQLLSKVEESVVSEEDSREEIIEINESIIVNDLDNQEEEEEGTGENVFN
ncbi:hypothetical protein QUF55_10405 [Clostridiaceae bacterium HSG29]|nr:hypothetical protein [Clostridiaceae bacterium HSG29]